MKIDRANMHRKLESNMVERIKDALYTYWKSDHVVIKDNDFLEQLPTGIRRELINHLF